jgi:hypothetical protein
MTLKLRRARPSLGNLGKFGAYLFRAGPAEEASFTVSVIGQWSRSRLGGWTSSLESLGANWTRYEFEIDAFGIEEPMQVLLEVPAGLAGRLAVGLAKPQAVDDYVLTLNGRKVGERPMAVQVFEGVPAGLRRGAAAAGRDAASIAGGGQRALSLQLLQTAALQQAPKVPPGSPIVTYVADREGVLVHPTGTRPTIAVIRNVEAGGARSVSALVRHVADAGTAAECAICAVETSAIAKSGEIVFDKKKLAGLSWSRVSPQQAAEVHYKFPESVNDTVDIFLLSRSPTPRINSAWSVFTNVRLGA